jgi:uncharacterized membrane protein AbrB (regulator of aidB expression)
VSKQDRNIRIFDLIVLVVGFGLLVLCEKLEIGDGFIWAIPGLVCILIGIYNWWTGFQSMFWSLGLVVLAVGIGLSIRREHTPREGEDTPWWVGSFLVVASVLLFALDWILRCGLGRTMMRRKKNNLR